MQTQRIIAQSSSSVQDAPSVLEKRNLSISASVKEYLTANAMKRRKIDSNSPPSSEKKTINERQEFLIFVKSLLELLKASGNEDLVAQAKQVIRLCTKRNRLGDKDFIPLQRAIEQLLFPVVGEKNWTCAKRGVLTFCLSQGFQVPNHER